MTEACLKTSQQLSKLHPAFFPGQSSHQDERPLVDSIVLSGTERLDGFTLWVVQIGYICVVCLRPHKTNLCFGRAPKGPSQDIKCEDVLLLSTCFNVFFVVIVNLYVLVGSHFCYIRCVGCVFCLLFLHSYGASLLLSFCASLWVQSYSYFYSFASMARTVVQPQMEGCLKKQKNKTQGHSMTSENSLQYNSRTVLDVSVHKLLYLQKVSRHVLKKIWYVWLHSSNIFPSNFLPTRNFSEL